MVEARKTRMKNRKFCKNLETCKHQVLKQSERVRGIYHVYCDFDKPCKYQSWYYVRIDVRKELL